MSTKKNEAWDAFVSTMSPAVRKWLTSPDEPGPLAARPVEQDCDDDAQAYDAFVASLTPAAREVFARAQAEPPVAVDDSAARWGVVEAADGEWAQMRLFKSAEALARRLQQLEGSDTVVWCFYGVPLPISKGPQRYVALPGGKQLIQVPLFEGGPTPTTGVDAVAGLKYEEAGYLGPIELAESHPLDSGVPATASADDDDD